MQENGAAHLGQRQRWQPCVSEGANPRGTRNVRSAEKARSHCSVGGALCAGGYPADAGLERQESEKPPVRRAERAGRVNAAARLWCRAIGAAGADAAAAAAVGAVAVRLLLLLLRLLCAALLARSHTLTQARSTRCCGRDTHRFVRLCVRQPAV